MLGLGLKLAAYEQFEWAKKAFMLVRLTRAKRLKAGRFLALIYLLCLVAPTASFAFSKVVPHCLTMAGLGISSTQMHGSMQMHSGAGTEHVHGDSAIHNHSSTHSVTKSGGDNVMSEVVVKETSAPAKAPHKSSDSQCCGLMCLTAMPATLVDIVTPPALTVTCVSESLRDVADNAPVRHYRPPIS